MDDFENKMKQLLVTRHWGIIYRIKRNSKPCQAECGVWPFGQIYFDVEGRLKRGSVYRGEEDSIRYWR